MHVINTMILTHRAQGTQCLCDVLDTSVVAVLMKPCALWRCVGLGPPHGGTILKCQSQRLKGSNNPVYLHHSSHDSLALFCMDDE